MRQAIRLLGSDLACIRGGRQVFRDLGFAVGAGEALAVTGPNGVGKSTLLRLIAGLVRPSHGRLALEGGNPELTIGEQAHYLGHQDALKPALSVRENLGFWADFLGGGAAKRDEGQAALASEASGQRRNSLVGAHSASEDARERAGATRPEEGSSAREALAAVGLDGLARLPATYLSAGQRRRLSLARLIAVERPIWLLDEPTSALDAAAQAMLADLMRTHLGGGGLILAATHGPIGLEGVKDLRLGDSR
jgi:heme exporter protein A